MTKFEAGKEYPLRNGWKAKVLMTDSGGNYPLIGAYYDEHRKVWETATWTEDGRSLFGDDSDPLAADLLPPLKPKHAGWVNVYKAHHGERLWASLHESREDCDYSFSTSGKRIACIRIEFEEGEGL